MYSARRVNLIRALKAPQHNPSAYLPGTATVGSMSLQFKAGGWEPWAVDGSTWFDLTPEGKKRLYARMFEPGYMQTAVVRVPKMYGMTFRLKCVEGCWTREPPYKFLIDVSVSDDFEGWERGDPMIWQKAHPAHKGLTGPAQTKRSGEPAS